MANSEIVFQNEIIDEVKNKGGFAYKLSNAVLVGVSDLEIKFDFFPLIKIECKFFKFEENFKKKTIRLTSPQHEYLKKFAFAQGYSNIWVGFKGKLRGKTIFGCKMFPWLENNDYLVTLEDLTYKQSGKFYFANDGATFIRNIGQPWPVEDMVKATPDIHKEEP